jgi:hypothetical protein
LVAASTRASYLGFFHSESLFSEFERYLSVNVDGSP